MKSEHVCPIWGTWANVNKTKADPFVLTVNSPRTSGEYIIHETVKDGALVAADTPTKLRLTTWLVEQRRQGNTCPEITNKVLEQAKFEHPLVVHERVDRLLTFLAKRTPKIGESVLIEPVSLETKL